MLFVVKKILIKYNIKYPMTFKTQMEKKIVFLLFTIITRFITIYYKITQFKFKSLVFSCLNNIVFLLNIYLFHNQHLF